MTGDVTTRSALLDSLWRSVDSFFDDERSRTRAAFRWRSRATIAANGRWARRVVLNAPVRHRANSSLGRIIGQPGKDARWKEIDAKCYMNMRPLYQPQVTQTEAGARTMCERFSDTTQARRIPSAIDSNSAAKFRLPNKQCRALRNQHFDLTQHHDLLRTENSSSAFPSPFPSSSSPQSLVQETQVGFRDSIDKTA